MGQTTDQIETQIENKREDLKTNLAELQTRVKTATDWRHYFAEHTGTMIAAAFGGGVLLATMVAGRSNRTSLSPDSSDAESGRPRNRGTRREVLESVDSIKSALVGVAATRFKGILGAMVPGFTEHLAKAEADRSRQFTH
jgi:hypothetical protein